MARPIYLAVHRNTKERHEAKVVAGKIHKAVDACARDFKGKLAGYCIIAWDRDTSSFTGWYGAKHLGQFPLPEFVRYSVLHSTWGQDINEATGASPPPDDSA